jgi:maltose alpha-D-glucosyltransferase/alpha-amylase
VLRAKSDFVILDFEGEPTRTLADRRAKQSPLKDVAGMLRSFSYAAYASLNNHTSRHPGDVANLERWAQLWERSASAEFLRAYRQTMGGSVLVPANTDDFRVLLDIFLLDKVLYEIVYELNSRPAWVRIPLLGIMSLPAHAT